MTERTFRRDERVPVNLECHIAAPKVSLTGRISDLGLGGLSAHIDQCLEQGTTVTVAFTLLSSITKVQARVQWCRQEEQSWQVGLAFEDTPGAILVDLAEWLARVPRTEEIP